MMLALPDEVKARHDVGAVAKLMISSAPARKDTKLAILEHFRNGSLYELYGSTEAGWVTLLRPEEQIDKLGSVGREWAGTGAIRLLDPKAVKCPTARSANCTRARPTSSTATGRTRRRRPSASAATGARWATWPAATPTATSRWSTARAT